MDSGFFIFIQAKMKKKYLQRRTYSAYLSPYQVSTILAISINFKVTQTKFINNLTLIKHKYLIVYF